MNQADESIPPEGKHCPYNTGLLKKPKINPVTFTHCNSTDSAPSSKLMVVQYTKMEREMHWT